jgi:hypothetical protein
LSKTSLGVWNLGLTMAMVKMDRKMEKRRTCQFSQRRRKTRLKQKKRKTKNARTRRKRRKPLKQKEAKRRPKKVN